MSILTALFAGGKLLNLVQSIGEKIVEERTRSANAKTEIERIQSNERVRQLEFQRDILIAEQKNWATRWVRPMLAAPFVIYVWKVIVWDKVLKLGVTDGLDDRMWWVFGAFVLAYFGTRPWDKRR